MNFRIGLLSASVALALSTAARADDSITWHGYLNVVGGILQHEPRMDDSDKKQYPGNGNYDNTLTFDPQSSGAIQATKVLDEKTLVTAQLYAEGRSNDYSASMKWLYLTYNLDANSTFRVGKIGAPIYFYTDFLNVGFAYHWVSLPSEVYRYDTTVAGVDYVYRNYFDDVEWSAEAFGGSNDQTLAEIDATVKSRNLCGLSFQATKDSWLTGRISFVMSEVSIFSDQLTADALLDTAIPKIKEKYPFLTDETLADLREGATPALAEKLDYVSKKSIYADIFLKADLENWLMVAEATHSDSDAYLAGPAKAVYFSVGYRLSDAMIYTSLSNINAGISDDAKADLSATTDIAAQLASQVSAAYAQDGHATTLGVRFDTSPNTAVKFEVTGFEEKASVESETGGIGKNVLVRAALNASF